MTVPTLEPRANASSIVSVSVCPVAASTRAHDSDGAVHSVPRGQLYFWSHAWQKLEQEAADELANGDFEDFDDPGAALRWLLSTED